MSHTVSWSKLVRPVEGSIPISDRGREPDVNAFLGKAYEISHIQSSICVSELLNIKCRRSESDGCSGCGETYFTFYLCGSFYFFLQIPKSRNEHGGLHDMPASSSHRVKFTAWPIHTNSTHATSFAIPYCTIMPWASHWPSRGLGPWPAFAYTLPTITPHDHRIPGHLRTPHIRVSNSSQLPTTPVVLNSAKNRVEAGHHRQPHLARSWT